MRGLLFLATAAALLAGQAQAQAAPERFDLNCQLVETLSDKPGETFPFTRQLSIDLAAGEFCFRDPEFGCKEIEPLNNVTDDSFNLNDVEEDFMTVRTTINRRTWTWDNEAQTKTLIIGTAWSKGPCTLAEFTPFPATAVRK